MISVIKQQATQNGRSDIRDEQGGRMVVVVVMLDIITL